MHWMASCRFSCMSRVSGPPPVMCGVKRHSHMTRRLKVLVLFVSVAVAAFIALCVATYLNPRSNKLETWRLNLQQIEVAKKTWAFEEDKTTNDTPTFDDLRFYLPDWATNQLFLTNGEVVDPDGGVYSIGRIGQRPSCLIGGRRIQL